MNHHDSHLAEWTFSWSSHEILTFYLWKCFNEFYKLFPWQQTLWMNHQCCRKGQKHFQHVQNSRIERLAAAQVEHTQTEEGCWFHSTLVLCMCSLVSPVCPKGGQSSSGDTVTHFWDIPWTRSSLEYCALKLTWRNSNGLTKEAQWMETEKKTPTNPSATLTKICCFKGVYSRMQVFRRVGNIQGTKACFPSMTLNVTAGYPWQQPENSWASRKEKCKESKDQCCQWV